jgi:hypothetical protein
LPGPLSIKRGDEIVDKEVKIRKVMDASVTVAVDCAKKEQEVEPADEAKPAGQEVTASPVQE